MKTNEDFASTAYDILAAEPEHGAMHAELFSNWANNLESRLGENDELVLHPPVYTQLLPTMPNAVIILADNVYKALDSLQQDTGKNANEHKFILGGNIENHDGKQVITFDYCYASIGDNNHTASFDNLPQDRRGVAQAFTRAENNPNNNSIICTGHSHPMHDKIQHNLSLMDLGALLGTIDGNESLKTRRIEICSCMITKGNYNFLFYDNQTNRFYRFMDVRRRTKYGMLKDLPAWTYALHTNILTSLRAKLRNR